MKSPKRLEELLDVKDDRIQELESELDKYHEAEEHEEWRWTIHGKAEEDKRLPVPRLEMRCEQIGDNWYNFVWKYALVYRHFLKDLVVIPMGQTRIGSGSDRCPNREIDLPFRDGVHIRNDAEHLKLPAFAIFGDGTIKDLTSASNP